MDNNSFATRRIWTGQMLLAGLLLVVLLGSGCAGRVPVAEETRPESYLCRSIPDPIAIDGRLDEAAWQVASVITNFHVFAPKGAENLSPTEARILWGSSNLYVAITCADADIRSYSDEPDGELWNGDVGEFFVKPDRDSPVYYEFVVAPNGTLYDGRYPARDVDDRPRFKSWSSGAQVASSINGTNGDSSDMDSGYTLEMAIPLSAFAGSTPPADGVVWTFGVCRYDYSKLFDEPLLLMTMLQAPYGFHSYEGYADLVFRELRERGRQSDGGWRND